MRKPHAATIFRWLKDNGMRLGALTDHDTRCLLAAVQIAEVWVYADWANRKTSACAFRDIVSQMQPETQYFAFHAIAHVADWCHRWKLWEESILKKEVLDGAPECTYGPRRNVT